MPHCHAIFCHNQHYLLPTETFAFLVDLGQGDACKNDFDKDNYTDLRDACPENNQIYATNFTEYQTIKLDPEGTSQVDPNWSILDKVRMNLNDNIFTIVDRSQTLIA